MRPCHRCYTSIYDRADICVCEHQLLVPIPNFLYNRMATSALSLPTRAMTVDRYGLLHLPQPTQRVSEPHQRCSMADDSRHAAVKATGEVRYHGTAVSQTRPVKIWHRNYLKMHCILRRGARAPAQTRSLAITLQSLFYTMVLLHLSPCRLHLLLFMLHLLPFLLHLLPLLLYLLPFILPFMLHPLRLVLHALP